MGKEVVSINEAIGDECIDRRIDDFAKQGDVFVPSRNGEAIAASMKAFRGSPEQARAIITRHRSDYLLTCRT